MKSENFAAATTSLSDLTALNLKKIEASLLADEGRALWSELLATATTSFLDGGREPPQGVDPLPYDSEKKK